MRDQLKGDDEHNLFFITKIKRDFLFWFYATSVSVSACGKSHRDQKNIKVQLEWRKLMGIPMVGSRKWGNDEDEIWGWVSMFLSKRTTNPTNVPQWHAGTIPLSTEFLGAHVKVPKVIRGVAEIFFEPVDQPLLKLLTNVSILPSGKSFSVEWSNWNDGNINWNNSKWAATLTSIMSITFSGTRGITGSSGFGFLATIPLPSLISVSCWSSDWSDSWEIASRKIHSCSKKRNKFRSNLGMNVGNKRHFRAYHFERVGQRIPDAYCFVASVDPSQNFPVSGEWIPPPPHLLPSEISHAQSQRQQAPTKGTIQNNQSPSRIDFKTGIKIQGRMTGICKLWKLWKGFVRESVSVLIPISPATGEFKQKLASSLC